MADLLPCDCKGHPVWVAFVMDAEELHSLILFPLDIKLKEEDVAVLDYVLFAFGA